MPAATSLSIVEARARAAADAMAREDPPVRYLRSIPVPGDEICFHLFESPSQEAVAEASRRAALTFTRIVDAVSVSGEEA